MSLPNGWILLIFYQVYNSGDYTPFIDQSVIWLNIIVCG